MKNFLITAAALMAFLFAAQTAQAAQVTGTIKVEPTAEGMLFADGIECGGGKTVCSKTVTWDDAGPAPFLSIFPHGVKAGFGITSWSGCDRLPHMNDCRVDFPTSGTKTVLAAFYDVAPPTVRIAGYSDLFGDTMYLNVEASDNVAVSKVEYLVDGAAIATRTGDYFNSVIDMSEVSEGLHEIKVRAWDGNDNSADSLAYTVRIDHTAPGVELVTPLGHTNAASPEFNFEVPGETQYWADCAIRKPGETVELTTCGYGEPYSQQVPTEGQWEFVVEVSDAANNRTRIVHPFVVERSAPVIEFTSGPADGAELKPGNVSYGWSATDQLALSQTCAWDGGEAVECDGSASRSLEAGAHTLTVEATDLAGNSASRTRSVTIKEKGGIDDPDPDTSDKTAPVVKLVAPRQKLRGLGKALRLNVRCDEACSGRVVVKGKRGIKFAGRIYLTKAGVAKLRIRPTAKVRKRLVGPALRTLRPRALRLNASASLTDKAGNTGKAALRFRVAA